MDAKLAASAYREASIENAPPVKVIRLMYEGGLRFLQRAELCDPSDPRSDFVYWLGRADAIVSELRMALDHEAPADNGDESVSRQLESLYLFCEGEIHEALAERSTERLTGVRQVLTTLADAWRALEGDGETETHAA